MFKYRCRISSLLHYLIGFISIAVTVTSKNSQEKTGNSPRIPKNIIYIAIFFLICLIVVWALYFLGDSFTIDVIQQYVVYPLQQVVNVITPLNGKYFQLEGFILAYSIGFAILTFPVVSITVSEFFSEKKKTDVSKVFGLIGRSFCIIIFSAWLEYYLSFSTYNTFMEFSFIHFLIANIILNTIILVAVIWIMCEFDLISS